MQTLNTSERDPWAHEEVEAGGYQPVPGIHSELESASLVALSRVRTKPRCFTFAFQHLSAVSPGSPDSPGLCQHQPNKINKQWLLIDAVSIHPLSSPELARSSSSGQGCLSDLSPPREIRELLFLDIYSP